MSATKKVWLFLCRFACLSVPLPIINNICYGTNHLSRMRKHRFRPSYFMSPLRKTIERFQSDRQLQLSWHQQLIRWHTVGQRQSHCGHTRNTHRQSRRTLFLSWQDHAGNSIPTVLLHGYSFSACTHSRHTDAHHDRRAVLPEICEHRVIVPVVLTKTRWETE